MEASERETHPSAWLVIMAGGAGTRFWPASRRLSPKQLLPLGPDDRPLLRATLDRVSPLVAPERTLVVTGEHLRAQVRAIAPELPPENIMAEPEGRNTAPCIGWAAHTVARRAEPSAPLLVLPADHHVAEPAKFRTILATALDACSDGTLVTVGIEPTRPETGYGYIEVGDELRAGVRVGRRFVEKPDRARAEEFLAAGTYLWNGGIFCFRADAILEELSAQLPTLARGLRGIADAAAAGDEPAGLAAHWDTLPSISIDHGVMEGAAKVAVVPGSFGWSDLGSWLTAWELAEKDPDGNAGTGSDSLFIESKGCFVSAHDPEKVVAVIGLEDLVIVDTERALLVVPRERAQDVRVAVARLKERPDAPL